MFPAKGQQSFADVSNHENTAVAVLRQIIYSLNLRWMIGICRKQNAALFPCPVL